MVVVFYRYAQCNNGLDKMLGTVYSGIRLF
jgi:hypothetical protein